METPLIAEAASFTERLGALKAEHEPQLWYPYDIMGNVWWIEQLLDGGFGALLSQTTAPVADIGAADGDLGYFLESRGCEVDFLDWPRTNWNQMRGVRRLHELLGSRSRIHEVDLDTQFAFPRPRYGLAIALGILYHLKNPFFALEKLSFHADRLLLSTRIAARTGPGGVEIKDAPVAYLLDPSECNNDDTNFWIFSDAGLRRLLARCGWHIDNWMTVGCKDGSEPAALDRDERAFLLARSARPRAGA